MQVQTGNHSAAQPKYSSPRYFKYIINCRENAAYPIKKKKAPAEAYSIDAGAYLINAKACPMDVETLITFRAITSQPPTLCEWLPALKKRPGY